MCMLMLTKRNTPSGKGLEATLYYVYIIYQKPFGFLFRAVGGECIRSLLTLGAIMSASGV